MAYFKKIATSGIEKPIAQEVDKNPYTDLYGGEIPEEINYYKAFFTKILHTGSRVICDPPVLDTDDDWVLLVREDMMKPFEGILSNSAFKRDGSPGEVVHGVEEGSTSHFHSWKKKDADGEVNLILTSSEAFLEKSAKATWLAKKLNLQKKGDRIAVFRAIREDMFEDAPEVKMSFKGYMGKAYYTRVILDDFQFQNQNIMINEARRANLQEQIQMAEQGQNLAIDIEAPGIAQPNHIWQVNWGNNAAQAIAN